MILKQFQIILFLSTNDVRCLISLQKVLRFIVSNSLFNQGFFQIICQANYLHKVTQLVARVCCIDQYPCFLSLHIYTIKKGQYGQNNLRFQWCFSTCTCKPYHVPAFFQRVTFGKINEMILNLYAVFVFRRNGLSLYTYSLTKSLLDDVHCSVYKRLC